MDLNCRQDHHQTRYRPQQKRLFRAFTCLLRKALKSNRIILVPSAGLEPARPIRPRDFKSPVSTIPPRGHALVRPDNSDSFSGVKRDLVKDLRQVFAAAHVEGGAL